MSFYFIFSRFIFHDTLFIETNIYSLDSMYNNLKWVFKDFAFLHHNYKQNPN